MMMGMANRSSTIRVTALRRTEKSHSKSKMFQKAALSHPGWIIKGSDLRKETEPSSPVHHIASMSALLATDGFWHSFCLEWYLYMLRVNLCLKLLVSFFLVWAVMTAAVVKEAGVSWPRSQPVTGNVIFTAAPWKTISLLSAWLSCPSAPHRVGDTKNTTQWTSSHHSCQLTHNHVHLCCPAGKSIPMNWEKNHTGTLQNAVVTLRSSVS